MVLPIILTTQLSAENRNTTCIDSLKLEQKKYFVTINLCAKQIPHFSKKDELYFKGFVKHDNGLSCDDKIKKLKTTRDSLLFLLKTQQLVKSNELDSLKRELFLNQKKETIKEFKKAHYSYFQKKFVLDHTLKKYKLSNISNAISCGTSVYNEALSKVKNSSLAPELPANYQTKAKVNKELPYNQPNINLIERKKAEEQVKQIKEKIKSIKDSINSDSTKLFKLNSCRELPFRSRFKGVFIWSPQRPSIPRNIINLDVLIGLQYNINTKASIVGSIGNSTAIFGEKIPQGIKHEALIIGFMVKREMFRKAYIFINYEFIFPNNSDLEIERKPNYRFQIGVENNNYIKTQIGLNLLAFKQRNQQFFTIRFSL